MANKKGWIIEFDVNSGDFGSGKSPEWLRSINPTCTIFGAKPHDHFVFSTRESARKEVKAQTDSVTYRIVREA